MAHIILKKELNFVIFCGRYSPLLIPKPYLNMPLTKVLASDLDYGCSVLFDKLFW